MRYGRGIVGFLVAIACDAGASHDALGETSDGAATEAPFVGSVVVADGVSWSPASDSADPVPEHRPTHAVCEAGFGLEYGTFEIDTGLCSYAVFEQPALHAVPAGVGVRIVVVHDHLWAPEPATAHVVLSIGDIIVFDEEVAIPGPYGLIDETWIADRDVPSGAPVRLHLHNHGVNSWRILDVKTVPP